MTLSESLSALALAAIKLPKHAHRWYRIEVRPDGIVIRGHDNSLHPVPVLDFNRLLLWSELADDLSAHKINAILAEMDARLDAIVKSTKETMR